MKLQWVILLMTAVMLSGCGMESVQVNVEKKYTNDEGLIHAYPLNQESEYLSESLGLYMEYLLLVEDEREFHKQYEILWSNFVVKRNGSYFIRWQSAKEINTNALIDDKRIIKVLQQAAGKFNKKDYSQLAEHLNKSISTLQEVDGYTVDFYDWKLKLAAKRVTLSYLEHDVTISDRTFNLLETVKDSNVFFPEYYDLEKEQYIENSEIHMIDQLLIAKNRLDINKSSPVFEKWIKQEWEAKGKIYGRYSRGTFEPTVEYESLAVYYYLYAYFLRLKEDLLAQEVKNHAETIASEEVLESAHFFDYIYFQLMLKP